MWSKVKNIFEKGVRKVRGCETNTGAITTRAGVTTNSLKIPSDYNVFFFTY